MPNQFVNKTLRRMHLPIGLTQWIRAGRLASEVDAAYKQLDALTALLDDWEVRNPEAAKLTPWFPAREAWKQAGRPQPHWIEALMWREKQTKFMPVQLSEIENDLIRPSTPELNAKRRARRAERQSAAVAQREADQGAEEGHEARTP